MISFSPIMTTYHKGYERTLPLRNYSSEYMHRFSDWLVKQHYGDKMHYLYLIVLKTFTVHPAETNETYLEHLWFTVKTSARFTLLGILLFTHGVFPFLFTRTVSKQIERIYLIMRNRIPLKRRETIEGEYEI